MQLVKTSVSEFFYYIPVCLSSCRCENLFRPSVRTGAPSPKGKARRCAQQYCKQQFIAWLYAFSRSPFGGRVFLWGEGFRRSVPRKEGILVAAVRYDNLRTLRLVWMGRKVNCCLSPRKTLSLRGAQRRGNPPVERNKGAIITKKRGSSHSCGCFSVHFTFNRGIATPLKRTGSQ